MPSLPPDNEVIGSNEDSYSRYFGYLRSFSSTRPRLVFFKFIVQAVLVGSFLLAMYYVCAYLEVQHNQKFQSNSVNIRSRVNARAPGKSQKSAFEPRVSKEKGKKKKNGVRTKKINNYATAILFARPSLPNITIFVDMVHITLLSASLGYFVLCVLSYEMDEQNKEWNLISDNPSKWEQYNFCKHFRCSRYNVFDIWFTLFQFPIFFAFALVFCHLLLFKILIPRAYNDQSNRQQNKQLLLELQDTKSMNDSTFQRLNEAQNVDIGQDSLEKSGMRILKWMLLFVIVYHGLQVIWFVVSGTNPDSDWSLGVYACLWVEYAVGKFVMKRIGRQIDQRRLLASISLELIFEVFASSFYWLNLRELIVDFNLQSTTWIIIVIAHTTMMFFDLIVRPSNFWFQCIPRFQSNADKVRQSNWQQWQERCNLDNCVRFVIVIYSFVYVNVMLGIRQLWQTDVKKCHQTMWLFAAEMGYYLLLRTKYYRAVDEDFWRFQIPLFVFVCLFFKCCSCYATLELFLKKKICNFSLELLSNCTLSNVILFFLQMRNLLLQITNLRIPQSVHEYTI
ncbi:hypothetical protein RFI_01046 [Reticulomyxa filosa]|uniref:Uncharacterized protein n=1 Tax=Reticulomyxa filosa TaxID=46433 RepID=X6PCS7_RETFI|nr:hypothetical protein RFI_01046 [Reticulomyxa filosa]|eukprot:ETO36016.1 hypothetical protein RFI_01046 [Reticulomyxa filosa]